MRNIEIKAKIDDPEVLVDKLKKITKCECTVIKQCDTFFKTSKGRLKLRQFEDGTGELIYYERTNMTGPKLCNYQITKISAETCGDLKNTLSLCYGTHGIVEKIRHLFMIDQTRVHIDDVNGLGSFMELEVVLNDNQDISMGEQIAQDIMTQLGIHRESLVPEAYVDLLNKKKALI
ncbi:hypothetical protein KPH14_002822 [Odynerus spinipes]|uniref:CYTH domain-containing protein n=1 Tax=Odynerus spinipes TaxID=1348599 RepID=A0AAD9RG35_9HYME|nr:hypothetical protein KPH14_002822 [Odynerus spinipes]